MGDTDEPPPGGGPPTTFLPPMHLCPTLRLLQVAEVARTELPTECGTLLKS